MTTSNQHQVYSSLSSDSTWRTVFFARQIFFELYADANKKAGKTAGYTSNVVGTGFAFYCPPDASPLSMIFHMVDGRTLPIQCKSHMAEQHCWLLTQMNYLHMATVRNANTIFGRLCWPMIHVTDGRFLAGTIGPSCFGDWHLDLPPPPATCGPGIHLDWWGLPLVVGCRSTAQITRDQNSKK